MRTKGGLGLLTLAVTVFTSQMFFAGLEARAQTDSIDFAHRFETCLDQQTIFSDLTVALTDSTRSKIWPSNRSQVAGPQTPAVGERVQVTYKVGPFRRTYGYVLTHFAFGEFTYMADENHPFKGGATVQVIEDPNGPVTLNWAGEYRVDPNDKLARRFFESFRQDFFADLESNVRALERQAGCTRSVY